MKTAFLILTLAGLLAGCGGNDHDGHMASPPPAGTDGGVAADKFAAQVANLVATQPDDAEAAALDETAPTTPDDTEPQMVGP